MNTKIYVDKARKRLAHVNSHLESGYVNLDAVVDNIQQGRGNPRARAMTLSSHAQANAIVSWFEQHDLPATRQWWYVAAKLDQMWYQMEEDTQSPGAKFLQLLKPLLSNNEELIEWFIHYDLAYDMKRVENHKTHDFWAYQAIVALRGEWPRLIARCEKVLIDPPKTNSQQKYLSDYDFYLALAHGDKEKMQSAILELTASKVLNGRANDESGYTEGLISTPAVIYAKIAWRHGYQLSIDSPYIPAEWLPVEPSERYENYYDFLK